VADKELLSALVGKYGAYACIKPSQIKVRRSSTKRNATMKDGPQTFSFLDTTSGFQCLKSMQSDGSDCFDYEVQLCCPREFKSVKIGDFGVVKSNTKDCLQQ
jgi:hypothetical protein